MSPFVTNISPMEKQEADSAQKPFATRHGMLHGFSVHYPENSKVPQESCSLGPAAFNVGGSAQAAEEV